jgi:hypothetical protein
MEDVLDVYVRPYYILIQEFLARLPHPLMSFKTWDKVLGVVTKPGAFPQLF